MADAGELLSYLDLSGTGRVDAAVLREFIRKFNVQDEISEQDMQNLLMCYGQDGGGELDLQSFQELNAGNRAVSRERATESLQALKNDRETDAAGRLMTEPDSLVLALSSTPAGPGKRPALDAMAATQLVNASTKEGSSDVNHAAFIAVAEAGQSGTTNGK